LNEIHVLLNVKKFLYSFYFAFNGIRLILRERNFRIEILIFLIVLFFGTYFQITSNEWLVVLLISAIVLGLEAMNSAIEKLCDLYSTENNPLIKKIKDISAGAVLICSIIAAIIGILVFYPYFLNLE
jgi:diacylglycerol kinase